MPTSYKDIQGFFNVRFTDKNWWWRIREKAAGKHISINDLILALLDAWLEDKIEIKEG